MGCLHLLEGDSVTYEAQPPEHRAVAGGCFRTVLAPLCVRVSGPECVSTDEGAEKAFPRAHHQEHPVLDITGACLHA